MTQYHTTPEPWREVLEAILGSKPAANPYFRYETVPHRAITRLYHEIAPDVAAQQALSAAVFQLLDETPPNRHYAARLFHLIRATGAVKPAMGLNLLQKLLRENTFWPLKYDAVMLHTLLLSMAGEYFIGPSLAEWIRADCVEKSDFDHTLMGFGVLANQEINRVALSLLDRAIDLAASESQENQVGRELMGLSHPYADLYHWIRELRTGKPDLFEKSRRILGDYLLTWTDRLEEYSEPYQVLLIAEVFAGRKSFSMKSILTIASKQIDAGAELGSTTIDLLRGMQKWRTNPMHTKLGDFLHIQGGPGDVVILDESSDPKLLKLLKGTVGIEIDSYLQQRETEPAISKGRKSLIWTPADMTPADI
jgi:hypothetical protein